jgi:hypothetical protein
VLVLERREVLGGGVTEEVYPVSNTRFSYVVSLLRRVIRELARHGLVICPWKHSPLCRMGIACRDGDHYAYVRDIAAFPAAGATRLNLPCISWPNSQAGSGYRTARPSATIPLELGLLRFGRQYLKLERAAAHLVRLTMSSADFVERWF